MRNRWNETEAAEYVTRYGASRGADLALRTYASRLLGADPALVLHGGGNTSVKGEGTDVLGRRIDAVFVKASGYDLATIEPEGHVALELPYLRQLRELPELSDAEMLNVFHTRVFEFRSPTASLETLVHAFLPGKFIDHTHANAVLALSNQPEGRELLREALGETVVILPYLQPGFRLAKASIEAFEANPQARAMVWMHHGLVSWGETACASYSTMIELVTQAEEFLERRAQRPLRIVFPSTAEEARERVKQVAPIVRGLLARGVAEPERQFARILVVPSTSETVLGFVNSDRARELALTPPLTSDHLIRTKPLPLWIEAPEYGDAERLRAQIGAAIAEYGREYEAYFARNAAASGAPVEAYDPLPRVLLLPGLGSLCAGADLKSAHMVRDITEATLATKARIGAMGSYEGLPEQALFRMEYDEFQRAKLNNHVQALAGRVALVTGAAGAIGAGICEKLLREGCAVAAADLPGERLEALVEELRARYGCLVRAVGFDVTDPGEVARGFGEVVLAWGGLDLVIANAGVALVSSLREMDLEAFRRLERVNVEGTLNVLGEAGRHFSMQGSGGDVILISTKNVFAPGAKFGAYSATKAAAHQLARIASLELAELGVRVNMVAPDAVFGEGSRRSGLWAEVGPDRMRARGLDESGLEAYYRSRNLLKARITPGHVANAVMYFATRQSPTTGATIPVDGGLPDATPR